MTVRPMIFCDVCSRSAEGDDRWGVLIVNGRRRDVCPACVAQLLGWQNAYARQSA